MGNINWKAYGNRPSRSQKQQEDLVIKAPKQSIDFSTEIY